MGSKRSAYAPGAMLRLLVSLAGLSLCCLCLAPVARADWGTVYCKTTEGSLDVATAKSYIDAFVTCIHGNQGCTIISCQSNGFASKCTTLWTAGPRDFYMCGSLRCDNSVWIAKQWYKVIQTCTQNYGGVDRAAGFVSYNWTPGFWNKYGF